ncbi:hypothetical protein O7598_31205 [Micromonospora sp. WMMC241]|uniref:hypothetical protein n=1 Tax=Micromonospora sp. WMMC241 TaxID=3015159 RepID=UPI0022B6127F|nr:hypothetical protein [Micromonospora sp. WMMC241]MCZ7434796.1 hypothetical protein [Micromonospora sp. WMMC241]MCZ7440851.1 hypothetical protein [Micromonospora sp. WMMC241]MCZ7440894.1 hypothetical protein [Micromonospora sp. WMMC241]
MKTLLISAGVLTPTIALPPAITSRILVLVLLLLAVRAWRHARAADGLRHRLWAADIAIRDPELRRQAAADAHLPAGRRAA